MAIKNQYFPTNRYFVFLIDLYFIILVSTTFLRTNWDKILVFLLIISFVFPSKQVKLSFVHLLFRVCQEETINWGTFSYSAHKLLFMCHLFCFSAIDAPELKKLSIQRKCFGGSNQFGPE